MGDRDSIRMGSSSPVALVSLLLLSLSAPVAGSAPQGYEGPYDGACRTADGGYTPWGSAAATMQTATAACDGEASCVGFAYAGPGVAGGPYAEYMCKSVSTLCPNSGSGTPLVEITKGDGRRSKPNICYAKKPSADAVAASSAAAASSFASAPTADGQFFGFNSASVLEELKRANALNVASKANGATLERTACSAAPPFVINGRKAVPSNTLGPASNVLDGVYRDAPQHTFGPTGDFTSGCDLNVRLRKEFTVTHIGLYYTQCDCHPAEIRVTGERGEVFSFTPSNKKAQYVLFRLPKAIQTSKADFKILASHVNPATPHMRFVNPRGYATLQISQLEVWASDAVTTTLKWNPLIKTKVKSADQLKWNSIQCSSRSHMQVFTGTMDNRKLSDMASHDITCVSDFTGGASLGFKSQSLPICSISDIVNAPHLSVQAGGTFKTDMAIMQKACADNRLCDRPRHGVRYESTLWRQKFLKGYCKMLKWSSCRPCGKSVADGLSTRCHKRRGDVATTECRVAKTCKCVIYPNGSNGKVEDCPKGIPEMSSRCEQLCKMH